MIYIDQLGNKVEINQTPKRIVSLVPSQTEYLFDLGLQERIVGITRFCIHPKNKPSNCEKIGGTKQFDISKILRLQPDLVIANKEENYLEGIQELQKHLPVWVSDIYTVDDNYKMMKSLAVICGKEKEGSAITNEVSKSLNSAKGIFSGERCAYFIWRKPYMVAASNTFIHDMMRHAGLTNCFENLERYPEITLEQLGSGKPQFVFLSSEPYAFSEKHFDEFKAFAPNAQVKLVDGEIFSWYGSRLKYAGGYLSKLKSELLHTDTI